MKYIICVAWVIFALSNTALGACTPVEDKWLYLAIDIREGRMDRLECLVDGATLNTHDPKDGMESKPLHLAVKYNRPRIVQYLLDKGANIEALNVMDRTPLQMSISSGSVSEDAAAVLILNGANIEAQDGEGNTPLYWAVVLKNWVTANLLLERGADRKRIVGVIVDDDYKKMSIEEMALKSTNKDIRKLFNATN